MSVLGSDGKEGTISLQYSLCCDLTIAFPTDLSIFFLVHTLWFSTIELWLAKLGISEGDTRGQTCSTQEGCTVPRAQRELFLLSEQSSTEIPDECSKSKDITYQP
jgi:hypothetical protein